MINPFDSTAVTIVDVYRPDGRKKAIYQLGSGNFLGLEFSIEESGPNDFNLYFANYANIDPKDIIKVKVFDSTEYFFTGVVRRVPIKGSSNIDFTYGGFGLVDYLHRIITGPLTYTSETITDIIEDLLDTVIVPKTPIVKNMTKVETVTTSIASITFDYIPVGDALKQLKEIAASDGNQYLIGVDSDGEFFFKSRDATVLKTLVVGKNSENGIPEYNPQDESEAKTKYFIKDKDGDYIGEVSSSLENDIFEQTLTAPDIDSSDIIAWATGILTESETNTRKASIEWYIGQDNPYFLIADCMLRIISEIPATDTISDIIIFPFGSGLFGSGLFGGGQTDAIVLDDTLRVLSVKYIINGNEAKRYIQLGLAEPTLELGVLKIRNDISDLRVSLGR